MTPTPARCLPGNAQPGWLGFTISAGAGSVAAGRWWSVMSTSMPCAAAAATPSWLAMPLSTVTMSRGAIAAACVTISGVSP